jgi:hypothetical protein
MTYVNGAIKNQAYNLIVAADTLAPKVSLTDTADCSFFYYGSDEGKLRLYFFIIV